MTALLAIFIPIGYLMATTVGGRFWYRLLNWDSYTSATERGVFSVMAGLLWPVMLFIAPMYMLVTMPGKAERKTARMKRELERRREQEQHIEALERELGIGQQPAPSPAMPRNTLLGRLGGWLS